MRLLVCAFALLLVACESPDRHRAGVKAALTAAPQDCTAGMTMGSPMGWTSAAERTIDVKAPGFGRGAAPNLPIGVPNVSFGALVPRLLGNLQTDESPLLAMSLGMDVINTVDQPVNPGNVDPPDPNWPAGDYPKLRVGPHGWYAIEFTVDSDQLLPDDQPAPDIALAAGRGASVFCYVLPDSSTAPGGQYVLPSETLSRRILGPMHLGIGSNGEIHAMNTHIGFYQTDVATIGGQSRPLSPTPKVYFTLRREFIDAVGTAEVAHVLGVDASLVSSATIFVVEWRDNAWNEVVKFATAAELRIPDPETAVIDGLAIDTAKADGTEILFSLRHANPDAVSVDDEIMHVQFATIVPPAPPVPAQPPRRVVVATGGKYGSLGRRMGAGRAIGDFCTADPWLTGRGFEAFKLGPRTIPDDHLFARRKPNATAGPMHVVLPIAAMRAWRNGAGQMRVCMSAPPGLVPAGTGRVTVYWGHTSDVSQGAVKNGWQLLEPEFDLPDGSFQRDVRLQADLGPVHPPSDPANPPVAGMVARWELRANGQVYHSPVAALRN